MVTLAQDGTVEFLFFRPDADCVTLSGEFNGWNPVSLPMTKGPDGWWRYHLRLAPGYYQFRYLADGQWYTDYASFGLQHGPLGLNSVVRVEPAEDEASDLSEPLVFEPPPVTQGLDARSPGPRLIVGEPDAGRQEEVLLAAAV